MSAESERLPPPNSSVTFESLCLDLWQEIWQHPGAQKNGRSGQPQAGVDVVGRQHGKWVGVQCKQKDGLIRRKVTAKELEHEVSLARNFKPKLSAFILATTAPANVKLQERARELTDKLGGSLMVEVWSWEKIWHEIYGRSKLLKRIGPLYWPQIFPLKEGLSNARKPAKAANRSFSQRWMFETTNDENFSGRDEVIEKLSEWARNPSARVIGVCAVGGTGKTALVGHWLKRTRSWRRRPFHGLFAWSFYENRSTQVFLTELTTWIRRNFSRRNSQAKSNLLQGTVRLLREFPVVVLLDGMEVMQEVAENSRCGAFLDRDLFELLFAACEDDSCKSLAVLTSRLTFTDLERYLGTRFHQLELHGMASDEGARLLHDLGVRGTKPERKEVSSRLAGHPFGLRIFAESISMRERAQPLHFVERALKVGHSQMGTPLTDKLARLLHFYEQRLPRSQVLVLGIVSLFRSQVAEHLILRFFHGLKITRCNQPLPAALSWVGSGQPADEVLRQSLKQLHSRNILTFESVHQEQGYACHPILKEHFRHLVLTRGGIRPEHVFIISGARTAQLYQYDIPERPQTRFRDSQQMQPFFNVIDLLLELNETDLAQACYRTWFKEGLLLQSTPAVEDGLACALGFVSGRSRRHKLAALSLGVLRFFFNEIGVLACMSGRFELALRNHRLHLRMCRLMKDDEALCLNLRNQIETEWALGHLRKACQICDEAVEKAIELRNSHQLIDCIGLRGAARALLGESKAAATDFLVATKAYSKISRRPADLYRQLGNYWAELLIKTGHYSLAERVLNKNIRKCRHEGWKDALANCYELRGMLALCVKTPQKAAEAIARAEQIFFSGSVQYRLAHLHVSAGRLALARRDFLQLSRRVSEALAFAQPRNMKLVQMEALILRGRGHLAEGNFESALNDSIDALHLARSHLYLWAERDALGLEGAARTALARTKAKDEGEPCDHGGNGAAKARKLFEGLNRQLALTKRDLVSAHHEAETWLNEKLTWRLKPIADPSSGIPLLPQFREL